MLHQPEGDLGVGGQVVRVVHGAEHVAGQVVVGHALASRLVVVVVERGHRAGDGRARRLLSALREVLAPPVLLRLGAGHEVHAGGPEVSLGV